MSSVELGEQNLRQGRNDAAFEIFFDLAQYELSADAQFALIKMCFDGLLKTDQAESLMNWLNRETARVNCCQFRSITKESFSIVNHCSNMG